MRLIPRVHRDRDETTEILADISARIGKHVKIPDGAGVEIYFGATIGRGAEIGRKVKVLGGATIGDGVVLCDNVTVGWRATIEAGVWLGDGVEIGSLCHVGRDVVVPAGTIITAGTNVYCQADILPTRV